MRVSNTLSCALGCALMLTFAPPALSQGAEPGKPGADEVPKTTNFGGLNFGVGLSLTYDLGRRSRVASAEVVNGIVRVKEQQDAIAGLVLESHYFFVNNDNTIGFGPFVAIEAGSGSNSVINAYGIGFMVGFRQPTSTYNPNEPDKEKRWTKTYGSSSWNFGVGLRVDPKVRVLGDGIVANQPLPAGETAVRFKDDAQMGVMVLSSFTF